MTTTTIHCSIQSETTEAKCLDCGREFTTHRMALYDRVIVPSICDSCADLRDSRQIEWALLCPLEFRMGAKEGGGKTRIETMSAACPGWERVMDWKFGTRGLLIRGVTGRCKTRGMW